MNNIIDKKQEEKINNLTSSINELKISIERDCYDSFEKLVKEDKNLLKELRKNEEWNKKLQDRLDSWLEKILNRYVHNQNSIDFLLYCGATKKGALKKSIEFGNFGSFETLVEENELIFKELREEDDWRAQIQKKLDNWLEMFCNKSIEGHKNYIIFLLKHKASKNIIYEEIKRSIDKDKFDRFKFCIKTFKNIGKLSLDEIENIEWNKENKLKKQLNKWLEDNCSKKHIENIKFLLDCETDNILIYNQIKSSIEQNKLGIFKFFVKNFVENGISLQELRKNEEWNKKLQDRLDSWLEENLNKYENDKNIIDFLSFCGADKKEALKISVDKNHYNLSFKKLIKEDETLIEKIREEGWKEKLNEKISVWLDNFCKTEFETNIQFILKIIRTFINEIVKISILKGYYNSFKRLVKEDENLLNELRKNEKWNKYLQYRLDCWLEKEFVNYDKKNINFLINKCGASKKSALKISIEKPQFKSFKNIIEEDKETFECLIKEGWKERIQERIDTWLENEANKYVNKDVNYYNSYYNNKQKEDYLKYCKKEENIKFLIDKCGASEEEALKISIENGHEISFETLIKRNILSRKSIKELKINNESLIKEMINYIYEENGLGTVTLSKIMKPNKFDEETKRLIIEVVKKTHPARANILKIKLNLK